MRISNQDLIKCILKALSDEKTCLILSKLSLKPMSAMDLIHEENLPVSSTYRKLSELEEEGLIGIDKTIIMDDGKSYNIFKSTFVELTISFEHGEITVDALPNKDIVDKAYDLFYSFRRRKS